MADSPYAAYEGLARARSQALLAEAARERLAREARAAADFVPTSRWRDPAVWSAIAGPIVGIAFLTYFVQAIGHALMQ